MAKINLDNLYTSSKYMTVLGLLKALIADVDAVDYTPSSDFTTLSTTVSTNTSDIASNKALINQNTANISANTASISTLNTKVEDNKTSTDNKIAVLEGNDTRHDSQINTLYSEVGTHTNDISTNKTSISANASAISKLDTKVDSNKESTDKYIAALMRNDENHYSQLTTLNTKVDKNISDINNNKNNIAINTKNIATNKANIATNKNDITTLKSAMSNVNRLYVHNIFIKDSKDTKLSFTLTIEVEEPFVRQDELRDVLNSLTNGSKDKPINCVGITTNTLYYLFAFDGSDILLLNEPGVPSGVIVQSGFTVTDTVLPTKLPTPVE